jgi:hypothetical protein
MIRKRSDLEFTRSLAKGRIAETIFLMMLREIDDVIILPHGYENTLPEIARFRQRLRPNATLRNISSNSDFLLIDSKKTYVYPVDVKFRWNLKRDIKYVKEKARESYNRDPECWYFIATPEGFYFDSCKNILEKTSISKLNTKIVPAAMQTQFTNLMLEFLQTRIVYDSADNPSMICQCRSCVGRFFR